MNSLLFQAADTMNKIMANNPLFADGDGAGEIKADWGWVDKVKEAVNIAIYPLLILLGTAGIIYGIVLGVKLAKAESADQQQEAKKRLVNFLIGIVATIALILLMKLIVDVALPAWFPNDAK